MNQKRDKWLNVIDHKFQFNFIIAEDYLSSSLNRCFLKLKEHFIFQSIKENLITKFIFVENHNREKKERANK